MEGYNMWREGHPTQKDWNLAFSEAYKNLKTELKTGETVIWDDGCLLFNERNTPRQIAELFKVKSCMIYVNTSKKVVLQRKLKNDKTKERGSLTEKEMLKAINMFEKPTKKEKYLIYNSKINLERWLVKNNFYDSLKADFGRN